jgi:hypothetical protein
VEPSSDEKVVVHQLQVEYISVDDNVSIILEDTKGQVKSLRLEQKPIDSIEQGESAENPPLEHICQDEKKGEDAHKANGGKGHGKQRTRKSELSKYCQPIKESPIIKITSKAQISRVELAREWISRSSNILSF